MGRAEVLAAAFALLACLVYIRAVLAGRFSVRAIAVIALSYALACLSKEVGVVLPAL